ncbi:MAG: glycosyltransferase family 2 protein [Bacteroidetes bacterium]|nr:glycosyltransferase family 2 protein [Bacteroidota bacterium]MCW5897098.1 glycosyltransferase family 2 protein [Bacteroidota bacterium]
MAKLSVITLVLNEEHNIANCLESVKWADEIIVVDSGSTDKTVELARRFTDKVLTVEWKGYGATKNVALDRATGDWILWLDADERVPPELAEEIQLVLREDTMYAGFEVARRAYFLGKWIRHCGWYPGRVTRLFRKDKSRFTETNVHEQIVVVGKIGNLQHDLLHFTDPDLQHYFSKFNNYTTLAAKDMHAARKTFSMYDILVRPPFLFFKMYIARRGFLDGIQGFMLSVVSSAYVFTKYAKLWELQHKTMKEESHGLQG